jgi:tetratricopeptide (TPR) repeat protein
MKPIPFTGRDTELQHIVYLWETATQHKHPQVVTLIGETGVGKTRLVHEFYHYLTRNPRWDPPEFNYWPNAFQTPFTQLDVNPSFSNHIPHGPPLFFWAGLRWSDPQQRNSIPDASLVFLRYQLIEFAKRSTEYQPVWKQTIREFITQTKTQLTWQNAASIVADSLVPLGGVILNILLPTLATFQSTKPATQLSDLILHLCREWFRQPAPLPMVLLLDDAQWMDDETCQFFAKLIDNAQQYHWPVLVIATYWPKEWLETDPQTTFLKQHQSLVLEKAPKNDLQTIIVSQFPNLKINQMQLLIEKSDGNHLTLIENIGELFDGASEYFPNGNTSAPMNEHAIKIIHTWESKREKRIAQRFEQFDRAIQNMLARAARIGIGTRFFINVINRFASNHNIHDVTTLLNKCISPLAVLHSDTSYVYEFRERDYFVAAYKIFKQRLQTQEEAQLLAALDTELIEIMQHMYDDSIAHDESIHESNVHYTSLDIELFAQLAMQRFASTHPTYFQTLVVICHTYATHYQWQQLRTLYAHMPTIDWHERIQYVTNSKPFMIIADALWMCGHIQTAGTMYEYLLAASLKQLEYAHDSTHITHIAHIYNKVIDFCIWHGNTRDGLAITHRAREFITSHEHDFHEHATYTYYIALTQVNMFYFMHTLDMPGTHDIIQPTVTQMRALVAHAPSIPHQRLLNRALIYLGWLDNKHNRTVYDEVLQLSQQIYAQTHDPDDLETLIIAHEYITSILIHHHQYTEAQQNCQQHRMLANDLIHIRQSPDDYKRYEMALRYAAKIAEELHDHDQAMAYWQEALVYANRIISLRESIFDLHDIAVINDAIGMLYDQQHAYAEAIPHVRNAYEMYKRLLEKENTTYRINKFIACAVRLGVCLYATQSFIAVIDCLTDTVNQYRSYQAMLPDTTTTITPEMIAIHVLLAHTYMAVAQPVDAQMQEQYIEQLIATQQQHNRNTGDLIQARETWKQTIASYSRT